MASVVLLVVIAAAWIPVTDAEYRTRPPRLVNIVTSFVPSKIEALRMDEKTTVECRFTLRDDKGIEGPIELLAVVKCANEDLCTVGGSPIDLLFEKDDDAIEQRTATVVRNITVHGIYLGRTILEVQFDNITKTTSALPQVDEFRVAVLNSASGEMLADAFTYFITLFIVTNTFMMGTQLKLDVIVRVLQHPVGPIIGLVCQYGLMPLAAFTYATILMSGKPGLQFGYFAVGCCPGGGMSNFWTILLDGNLNLSIAMTFFSNIAAFAMMPVWLYTLGRTFYGGQVDIPFQNVAVSLATLLGPACLGMLFIHFKPQLVDKFRKYIKIFTFIMIAIAIPFGIYQGLYLFRLMTWKTLLCGMALPWSGYALSFIVATLLRQPWADRRTIAVETGIQNASIAMVLCRYSLPEPDADLTLVMPLCVLLFTSLPLWFWVAKRKWCGKPIPDTTAETQMKPLSQGDDCDEKPSASI